MRRRLRAEGGEVSNKNKDLQVPVAGHSSDMLLVHPGVHHCGRIIDGVAFAHGRDGRWVISFADLERIYDAAKAQRQGQNP